MISMFKDNYPSTHLYMSYLVHELRVWAKDVDWAVSVGFALISAVFFMIVYHANEVQFRDVPAVALEAALEDVLVPFGGDGPYK